MNILIKVYLNEYSGICLKVCIYYYMTIISYFVQKYLFILERSTHVSDIFMGQKRAPCLFTVTALCSKGYRQMLPFYDTYWGGCLICLTPDTAASWNCVYIYFQKQIQRLEKKKTRRNFPVIEYCSSIF